VPTASLLSVVSYNVHQCVGFDGRRDPARIARIIQELKPDIVGLQEVSSESNGRVESLQMQYLADLTGLVAIPGPTITKHNNEYGNVLLSRYPVNKVRRLDLSVPGREPRGAIDAEIEIDHKVIRVIVSHLGLGAAERRYQVKQLLAELSASDPSPVFVIMDHNEWFPLRQSLRLLHERFGRPPRLPTFPSIMPFLPHDRVWVKPLEALINVDRYVTHLTRIASDHLPLRATIDLQKLF
jgi:endonuclease/exonuclease/phosphatase family metal-dependent hydrolase